jgi:Cft2 family RNA processing exonuclease
LRLTFHGAAGEVTGSCYLVDTGEVKFLIDCGMFQGGRAALLQWTRHFKRPPGRTWVVHGEPLPAHSLCDALNDRPGWRAAVPARGQRIDL